MIKVHSPKSDDRDIHYEAVGLQCGATLCGIMYFTDGENFGHFDMRVEPVRTRKSVTCKVCLSIVNTIKGT